jgi:hypothetical protein
MLKGWKARKPKYFFAAFGQKKAAMYPVDGGVNQHNKGFIKDVSAGDVLFLYCCQDYPGHYQEAPGIGIVIDTKIGGEKEYIYYQYFPLDHAVPLDIIKELPKVKAHQPPHFIGNWLYELSVTSFKKALEVRQVDWP